MITIGFRASATAVTFAVYNSARKAVLNVESIWLPAALPRPDALKLLRSNVLDILREYEVESAGIRSIEPNAQRISIARVEIEGVIQETFASSMLRSYYVGQISTITHRVGIPRTAFKEYIEGVKTFDGVKTFEGVEGWTGLSKEEREAVLCAIGAVNA